MIHNTTKIYPVHLTLMGGRRNAYKILARKAEGKRPLGIPRRRWKENITIGLRQIG
jgi:hypothetical protein